MTIVNPDRLTPEVGAAVTGAKNVGENVGPFGGVVTVVVVGLEVGALVGALVGVNEAGEGVPAGDNVAAGDNVPLSVEFIIPGAKVVLTATPAGAVVDKPGSWHPHAALKDGAKVHCKMVKKP